MHSHTGKVSHAQPWQANAAVAVISLRGDEHRFCAGLMAVDVLFKRLAGYISHHWGGMGDLPEDPIVRTALESAVSDLEAFRPDIVFIDRRNGQDYVKNGSFDFLTFYGQDPRFAGIWAGYVRQGETAGFDIYVAEGG